MRQVIQSSAAIFIAVSTTFAIAGGFDYAKEDLNGYSLQPDFRVHDQSDFSRDGTDFYFFGGYVYTDRFLSNKTLTVTNPTGSYAYVPKQVYPSTFNGFQVGVGKEWGRHIDFQLAYLQHFLATRSGINAGNTFNTSVKLNGVLMDVGYVFNPDDQFEVMVKGGAMVAEYYNKFTLTGTPYYTTTNSTKIDPAAGLDFIFQCNRSVALRLSTVYIADTQTSLSSGELNLMAGLSYTL